MKHITKGHFSYVAVQFKKKKKHTEAGAKQLKHYR